MIIISTTDIRVIRKARRCPATFRNDGSGEKAVWVRYTPRISGGEVLNVDLDTSFNAPDAGKEKG